METRSLDGKVAIVTGAGRGIGRAIARAYAHEGAKVVVASRTPATVDAVVKEIKDAGGDATGAPCDVGKREEVLACVVPSEPIADAARAATDIVAHTLRHLTYFKAPGYIAFVSALPLTATNKVQRSELGAWARELPGSSSCVDTRHLKHRS